MSARTARENILGKVAKISQNPRVYELRDEIDEVLEALWKQQRPALLVTGCPRSGTKSATKWWNDRGLDIGHEEINRDGTCHWKYAYQASEFPMVIVLIRDPIQCVNSLAQLIRKCSNGTHDILYGFADVGGWTYDPKEPMISAMTWWYEVYQHLFGLPHICVENLPGVNRLNPHIRDYMRKDITYTEGGFLNVEPDLAHKVLNLAHMYGYTKYPT